MAFFSRHKGLLSISNLTQLSVCTPPHTLSTHPGPSLKVQGQPVPRGQLCSVALPPAAREERDSIVCGVCLSSRGREMRVSERIRGEYGGRTGGGVGGGGGFVKRRPTVCQSLSRASEELCANTVPTIQTGKLPALCLNPEPVCTDAERFVRMRQEGREQAEPQELEGKAQDQEGRSENSRGLGRGVLMRKAGSQGLMLTCETLIISPGKLHVLAEGCPAGKPALGSLTTPQPRVPDPQPSACLAPSREPGPRPGANRACRIANPGSGGAASQAWP